MGCPPENIWNIIPIRGRKGEFFIIRGRKGEFFIIRGRKGKFFLTMEAGYATFDEE